MGAEAAGEAVPRPSRQLRNVSAPPTPVRMRSRHLPPRAPGLFSGEIRRFLSRPKLLLPSPGCATLTRRAQTRQRTRHLPRLVVMETAEDNAQGRSGGAERQQSRSRLSCGRSQGSEVRRGVRGAGQSEAPVASVPTATTALVRGKRGGRGGVEVTAEECLLGSLCHGFQRLSCEECSGRDNRTWNVTLCDKFSRRDLEPPLLSRVPCSPPLPPRASGPGSARFHLSRPQKRKVGGLQNVSLDDHGAAADPESDPNLAPPSGSHLGEAVMVLINRPTSPVVGLGSPGHGTPQRP